MDFRHLVRHGDPKRLQEFVIIEISLANLSCVTEGGEQGNGGLTTRSMSHGYGRIVNMIKSTNVGVVTKMIIPHVHNITFLQKSSESCLSLLQSTTEKVERSTDLFDK